MNGFLKQNNLENKNRKFLFHQHSQFKWHQMDYQYDTSHSSFYIRTQLVLRSHSAHSTFTLNSFHVRTLLNLRSLFHRSFFALSFTRRTRSLRSWRQASITLLSLRQSFASTPSSIHRRSRIIFSASTNAFAYTSWKRSVTIEGIP